MTLLRRLLIAVILSQVILISGTLGYRFIEGWSLLDALYMTVISITTVGYSEVHELSRKGVIFTVILIMTSVGIMAFIVASITQGIVAGQLRTILGRRKLEKRVKRMKDHTILCGYGRIGSYIARELHRENVPFVVVEKDHERIRILEEEGYPHVEGDATDDDCLVKAGLEKARALIAAVGSDADNLYITLSTRALKHDLYILARADEEAAEKKLLTAGADRVVSPYLMGAARMVNAVLRPNVVDFVDLVVQQRHFELQLEEILVQDDTRYKGKPLGESGIRQEFGLIVVAIRKASGEMAYNPSSRTLIEKGDILILLGEKRHLDDFQKLVQSPDIIPEKRILK